MTAKIQVRRDTTAQWASGTPPTLDVGEIGLDTDLKQIKIGDNVNNWTALPWLGGTLPYFSSPASDIDAATNRVAGVYRWAGIASITSGTVPAAPIDIKAADGGINMLVLKFGTTVMQHLWTDGDGTVTPKSYTRVYDGDVSAWRAWVPQNIWGISATEGVDVVAKSITLKDSATGLTVDGNSTLTGNLTVNGTTTLGNATTDIVTVQAGNVTSPIITTSGDLNTGIYFPAADEIALAAGGVQKFKVTSGTGVLSAQFSGGATFGNLISMAGFRISNVADPILLTDALNWQTLLSNIAIIATASNGATTASNGSSWTVANIASNVSFTPAAGGNYDGLIISFASGGSHNSGVTRAFNNLAVPTTTGGGSGFAILIAIKRS